MSSPEIVRHNPHLTSVKEELYPHLSTDIQTPTTVSDTSERKELTHHERVKAIRNDHQIIYPDDYDFLSPNGTDGSYMFMTQNDELWTMEVNPIGQLLLGDFSLHPDSDIDIDIHMPGDLSPFIDKMRSSQKVRDQLGADLMSQNHAKLEHIHAQNWDFLARTAYQLDNDTDLSVFANLACFTEVKLPNGKQADFIGIGPDWRIFIDDYSASKSPITLAQKMDKIVKNYMPGVQQLVEETCGIWLPEAFFVPRAVQYNFLGTDKIVKIYHPYDLAAYRQQNLLVA